MPHRLTPMKQRKFKKGEMIVQQGDVGQEAYRILKGSVQVYFTQEGKRVTLGMLGAGEIFGEMGMIDDKPRSATVQAIEATEVEVVTPTDFNEIILHKPDQLMPFMRSFFERLRRTNENFSVLLLPPAPEEADEKEEKSHPPMEPGTIRLVATTEHLRERVLKAELTVRKFPFRIGRWSENFQADVFVSNDLLVRDDEPYQISRNHCAIEQEGDRYYVLDRGSTFGTHVNGKAIGGTETQMVHALQRGENRIQLGRPDSLYQFQVIL